MNRLRTLLLAGVSASLLAAGTQSSLADSTRYEQKNLVSDGTIPAAHVDTHLVNAWGIAFNPAGFVWVNAADGGVSVLYDGAGNPAPVGNPLVVQIPSANNVYDPLGNPTGIVFSGSNNEFLVAPGAPARFIFASEQGIISAWAPTVDATHAIFKRQTPGAVYKGLALADDHLFAANFSQRRIDVFDNTFAPVKLPRWAFRDERVPHGYGPFNVQAIGDRLFVSYALVNRKTNDEIDGPGLGFVDEFSVHGRLIARVAAHGALNAPWGLALAPAAWGQPAGTLLVGNFGNGRINLFRPRHDGGYAFAGQVRDTHGKTLVIDGLWALLQGTATTGGTNVLWFSAGPDDEAHGLLGQLQMP